MSPTSALSQLVHKHHVAIIALILVGGTAVAWWQARAEQATAVEELAIQHARAYSAALTEFRSLYTSEVVAPLAKRGVLATHDYREHAGAIPLPATFSMMLGRRLGHSDKVSVRTRLYSAYPFPWRTEGGLTDDFAKQAWDALAVSGKSSFVRVESRHGERFLVLATPDRMRPACVHCHNTHPSTPRRGWKVGDVRGVLEVGYPMEAAYERANVGITRTLALLMPTLLASLLVLAVVAGRRRQERAILEAEVAERTAELRVREVELRHQVEERGKVEASLRQAEKMQAIGTLASGIAHDFNNNLAIITSYCGFARDALPAEHEARRDLDEAMQGVRRAQELVSELNRFARKKPIEVSIININGAVHDLARLLSRTLGRHIDLQLDLYHAPLHAELETHQLDQALLNMAANARDAMPNGGTLRIRTQAATAQGDDLGESGWLELVVSDDGEGMSEAVKQRIFEPFFTTKPAGQGTGLGMAGVYSLVQRSGGRIDVESAPGVGTTIRIRLPRAQPLDAAPPQEGQPPRQQSAAKTILVVDDERPLRDVVRRMLTTAGFSVQVAESGESVVRQLDTMPAPALLLTDVIMPGMSGPEVASRVQARFPACPVVFMSGNAGPFCAEQDLTAGGAQVVAKPFTSDELLDAVHAQLRRAADTLRGASAPR